MAEREQLPVQEAKDGDADAWSCLFKRYQLPLYVYICELVRDKQALHYAKRALRALLRQTDEIP